MKHARQTSIVLAALLQCLPVCRTLFVAPVGASPGIAIVFRWLAGAAMFLGSVDAVSGASTVITSPTTATGTNAVPFYYRITCGPQVANTFGASPLPPGLFVNTTSGKITGTPTQVGITICKITASDSGKVDRTTSTNLTITIVSGTTITPPSITTQPASKSVAVGSSVTFSVVATGTAPLSYQWRFNGASISGATSSSYTISSAQTSQAGAYSVVVSNAGGSATSANATLTVTTSSVAPPTITSQPLSQTVNIGNTVTLRIAATGASPLTYQWRFNGVNITGATKTALMLTAIQSSQAGAYSCVVANPGGKTTSVNAMIVIRSASTQDGRDPEAVGSTSRAATASATSDDAVAPLARYAGNYNGLFHDARDGELRDFGYLTLTAAQHGEFHAKLHWGGRWHTFAGRFDDAGTARIAFSRHRGVPARVELQLTDSDGVAQITGQLIHATGAATVLADRAAFDVKSNPCPFAGEYTLLAANDAEAGLTFGSVRVGVNGVAHFAGTLPDGTEIRQSTPLSQRGDWPFYTSLPQHEGGLLGWITFSETSGAPLAGSVIWVRPDGLPTEFSIDGARDATDGK
jgi:hypothetical protein